MTKRKTRYWVWAALSTILLSAAAGLAQGTQEQTPVEATPVEVKASSVKVVGIEVEGVTCAGCSATIRRALNKLDGVKEISGAESKKRLKITYDAAKTSSSAIVRTIEKAGFKARLIG